MTCRILFVNGMEVTSYLYEKKVATGAVRGRAILRSTQYHFASPHHAQHEAILNRHEKNYNDVLPFSFETARDSDIHSWGEEGMKFSRLLKIAKRACFHKPRGDHAALLEDQPLLALHLLQGHADRTSSREANIIGRPMCRLTQSLGISSLKDSPNSLRPRRSSNFFAHTVV